MRPAFVVHLGYCLGLDSTFGSLFVKPLELLRRAKINADVLCLSAPGEFLRTRLRVQWRNKKANFPIDISKNITRFPVAPSRLAKCIDESRFLAIAIALRYQAGLPLILHAIGSRAGFLAVECKRYFPKRVIYVVFHSLGPTADEYLYRIAAEEQHDPRCGKACYLKLKTEEDTAYLKADAVICLSQPMVDYAAELRCSLESIYKIWCLTDVSMFQYAIAERDATRRENGWEQNLVIVHSGALHPWQRPDAILKIFKLVQEVEPKSRLLILTRDRRVMERELAQSNIGENLYQILSLEFSEVPKYLAAADIGLLGRGLMEPLSVVNQFSSPIKFSEYLASGCPVVMGEGVGDFSSIVNKHGLGLVIPQDANEFTVLDKLRGFLASYRKNKQDLRAACQSFAEANLNVQQGVTEYQRIYESLLEGSDIHL